MAIIRARAPVRCCDLGGWTDTRIVPEGRVLNFAVSLYTHVTLHVGASSDITIESCDTDDFEAVRDVRQMEYNNVLDLFKAAIRRTGVKRGVRIIVRSDAPPGSGLGWSIVQRIAQVHGARLQAMRSPRLGGMLARATFPSAANAAMRK